MEASANMSTNDSGVLADHEYLLEKLNSEQFLYHLPAIVYTSLLMCIGTPGNVVVFYVYFFKWRKSTSRMFILFLTGLDLVNCVTTLPMEIFIMRFSIMLDIPWLCKTSRFSTYTMNSASAAILVAIAVDRFKRICRPHGYQFTSTVSKYICIACVIVAFILTWPALILYGTREIDIGELEGFACLIENQFDTTEYPYIFFIILMVSTVIIFTTLSILYYFVGLQIYKHRKFRMQRKKMLLIVQTGNNTRQTPVESNNSNVDTLLQPSDSTELKNGRQQANGGIQEGQDHDNECDKNQTHNHEHNELIVKTNNVGTETTLSVQNEDRADSKDSKRSRKSNEATRKVSAKTLKNSVRKLNDNAHCIKVRIGRSTLMLFLITLAYIISFLPFYIIAIIRQTYPEFKMQLTEGGLMTYYVFLRSYLLSSAINPIIYSFCNAQFRTFCFDMFRRRSQKHGANAV